MEKLKYFIIEILFPAKCLICNKIGQNICPSCFENIAEVKIQTCPSCNMISKQGRYCSRCRRKKHTAGIICSGYFKDPSLKEIIHAYKYDGIFSVSEQLANLLIKKINDEGVIFDIIAYVPISRKKLRKRGYNQAELIAQRLAIYYKKPIFKNLIKIRHTKNQVGLTGKKRRENLTDSFEIKNDSSEIYNKKVLLIDDVCTTGSTLNECANILRSRGAKSVFGAVIGKE